MSPPAVIRAGRALWVISPEGRPLGSALLGADVDDFARRWTQDRGSLTSGDELRKAVPAGVVEWGDPATIPATSVGVTHCASAGRIRAARATIGWGNPSDLRRIALAVARESFRQALSSPEQTLIALAREEERLARAERREAEAAAQLLAPKSGSLAQYARAQHDFGGTLARHHEALLEQLRESARLAVPNLSAVVGEITAARLLAAAGGLSGLARMSAARLQLLGARRRPLASRDGPRFGLILAAVRKFDPPVGREAAFARSLAALAVVAARADCYTHRDLASALVGRRERRLQALRRGRR